MTSSGFSAPSGHSKADPHLLESTLQRPVIWAYTCEVLDQSLILISWKIHLNNHIVYMTKQISRE